MTQTCRSGSTGIPYVRSNFWAMASRNPRAPHVMAYWLTSASIASTAARLTSSGAGKSGNPCARLTAPRSIASRVISRITDSVNDAAFGTSPRAERAPRGQGP